MAALPDALGIQNGPTRSRAFFASVFVVLTVIGVWKFIDYRTQPPPPPAVTAPR